MTFNCWNLKKKIKFYSSNLIEKNLFSFTRDKKELKCIKYKI